MKRLFFFTALLATGPAVHSQAFKLPYSGTVNSAQSAFQVTNSGSGPAATLIGNVGVGTDSPQENLSVERGINVDQSDDNNGLLDHALKFGRSDTGEGVVSKRTPGGNRWGLDLFTDHVSRLTITNAGNVGIGTSTPDANLSVQSGLVINQSDGGAGDLEHGLRFGHWDMMRRSIFSLGSPTGEGIASPRSGAINRYGLDFFTNHSPRLTITHSGQVGIGTRAPDKAVEIHSPGDVELGLQSGDPGGRLWTIQSSGTTGGPLDSTFQIIDRTAGVSRLAIDLKGTVSVGVLQITGGADVSEPFEISARDAQPGAVVVIDEQHPGSLKVSGSAYDRKVVGVFSGANGLARGISLRQQAAGEPGMDVALVGRVYVMADAANGRIVPGDLLTTSANPGHAMRATDERRSRGAVIGKAMTGLAQGQGFVLALINLQ